MENNINKKIATIKKDHFLRRLLVDKLTFIPLIISFILNITLWLFVYWRIKPQAEPIFLHYNIYIGIDLVGAFWRVYFFPGFALLALIFNYILSSFFYKSEKIISYFLMWFALFIQALFWVASFLIILLNI